MRRSEASTRHFLDDDSHWCVYQEKNFLMLIKYKICISLEFEQKSGKRFLFQNMHFVRTVFGFFVSKFKSQILSSSKSTLPAKNFQKSTIDFICVLFRNILNVGNQ